MKNPKEKQIAKLYAEASKLACERVEEIAREVLLQHPELDEFCMGMGTWFFSDKEDNLYDNDHFFCKKLDDFTQEWNEYLKLTGEPMRFTAAGPKITCW